MKLWFRTQTYFLFFKLFNKIFKNKINVSAIAIFFDDKVDTNVDF